MCMRVGVYMCVCACRCVYACIRELRGGVYSHCAQKAGFFIVIHVRDSEREAGSAAAKLVGPGRVTCVCVCEGCLRVCMCVCVREGQKREREFKRVQERRLIRKGHRALWIMARGPCRARVTVTCACVRDVCVCVVKTDTDSLANAVLSLSLTLMNCSVPRTLHTHTS